MNTLNGPLGNGIPLHCNICPKKPDFSDTSHLLTHIASKQHLANYYKMKVHASTNASAKRDIDAYDAWYEDWNLNDLMMERMTQKEKRSKGGGRKATGASSNRSTPSATAMPAPRREQSLRNNVLDPQLGHRIKTEPISRPSTPQMVPTFDLGGLHRNYGPPPLQGWPTGPYGHSPTPFGTSGSYYSDADEENDPTYGVPRRMAPSRLSDEAGSWQGSFQDSMMQAEDMGNEETPNENTRLKGDIWPGMAIFDSATPDMRRKRNQKKSISVLELLQATSETIEPSELVFDPDCNKLKTRFITGEPTSDSPVPGETSPEPDSPPAKRRNIRRPRGSRQALAERDANSGRNLRGRRAAAQRPPIGNARTSFLDGSDDANDDEMTFMGQRSKRTGFSIHRDNTGPDITFGPPGGRMNNLVPALHDPFQNHQNYGQDIQPQMQRGIGQVSHNRYQPQHSQSYHHQSRSSLGGFRAAEQNGLPAPRDLSAFGALTTHSMYPANTDFSSLLGGAQALNAFQQQFVPPPPFMQDNNSMSMQNWDVFGNGLGTGAQDNASFTPMEMNFGDAEQTSNPLYCNQGQNVPDDDQRTISAPQSDRERE